MYFWVATVQYSSVLSGGMIDFQAQRKVKLAAGRKMKPLLVFSTSTTASQAASISGISASGTLTYCALDWVDRKEAVIIIIEIMSVKISRSFILST